MAMPTTTLAGTAIFARPKNLHTATDTAPETAATLTEEAYGISLAKLVEGEDWGPRESFVLNVILIATWGVSCTMGAIVGAVVDVPTAIAAFVCTSLFICLLFSQRLSRGNVVAAVSGR